MDDACVRGLVDAWVKREGDKCTPIGSNDVLPEAGRGSAPFINATRADMTTVREPVMRLKKGLDEFAVAVLEPT